jgi:hypothetical protein
MNRSNKVQINEVAGYCPFKMHPEHRSSEEAR